MRRNHLLYLLVIILTLKVASAHGQDANVVAPPSSGQFTITSITVQGTNLLFNAIIPPGMEQVTLEVCPTLDAAWEEVESQNVSPAASDVVFTIPMPTNTMCFFRLEAFNLSDNSPVVSDVLPYVTMPSLASNLTTNGDAVFHFKGQVDGSDEIVIAHEGALWQHMNWAWPQAATINGVRWNPQEKNYMTTIGPLKFLPDAFSLESVNLQVTQGRDIIALERGTNSLIVHLDDTPLGSDEYDFTIYFHPVTPKRVKTSVGGVAQLKICAPD